MANEKEEIVIDDTLKVLLKFSKREFLNECSGSREEQISAEVNKIRLVLGPLYHYEMKLIDIVRVVFGAYNRMVEEPRFQTNKCDNQFNLLFAPVEQTRMYNGFAAIDSTKMSMYEIAYSYIKHMLLEMMQSNVGWCRHVLWPEEAPVQLAQGKLDDRQS